MKIKDFFYLCYNTKRGKFGMEFTRAELGLIEFVVSTLKNNHKDFAELFETILKKLGKVLNND